MFCGKSKSIESTSTVPFRILLARSFLTLSVGLALSGCSTAVSTQASATSAPLVSASIGQTLPITATAQLAGKTFQLEVARTPDQQAMGLMYRPALPDDRGMLFPMPEARPVTFWMHNVPVALDMVFIHKGSIVAIAFKVPPCATASCPTYGPRGNVDQVLELRAGRAEELGLKAGDPVVISALQ